MIEFKIFLVSLIACLIGSPCYTGATNGCLPHGCALIIAANQVHIEWRLWQVTLGNTDKLSRVQGMNVGLVIISGSNAAPPGTGNRPSQTMAVQKPIYPV